MTLEEAKVLLSEHTISFELKEFENEAAYWHHVSAFPYTKHAQPCRVTTLIIRSQNKLKDIELQFNYCGGQFLFQELWFGGYGFEESDCSEEILADDLLDRIEEIRSGNFVVIIANDLKNRRRIGDLCFDLTDDDAFGKPGYQKALQRIQKPKGFFSRLLKTRKQYEIYDWNNYQKRVK